MNNTLDYFSLKTANDLFAELKSAFDEFYTTPSDRLLMFIIFSANHLREWIAGKNWDKIKTIPKAKRTIAENFFCDIGSLHEFKIVNSLCNRGKHFITKHKDNKTHVVQGANCGLTKSGDSLSQYYYTTDDKDIRDIINVVVNKYEEWFLKIKS